MNHKMALLSLLAIVAIACSDDDESPAPSSGNCKAWTECFDGTCRCSEGPNKDKTCINGSSDAEGCAVKCKVCTPS
jgi:hypothetical protein